MLMASFPSGISSLSELPVQDNNVRNAANVAAQYRDIDLPRLFSCFVLAYIAVNVCHNKKPSSKFRQMLSASVFS